MANYVSILLGSGKKPVAHTLGLMTYPALLEGNLLTLIPIIRYRDVYWHGQPQSPCSAPQDYQLFPDAKMESQSSHLEFWQNPVIALDVERVLPLPTEYQAYPCYHMHCVATSRRTMGRGTCQECTWNAEDPKAKLEERIKNQIEAKVKLKERIDNEIEALRKLRSKLGN